MDGSNFQIYTHNCEIIPHRCIVKGDNLYASIASASILAKVARDKYINEMCDKYPLLDEYYGFEKQRLWYIWKVLNGISQWHRKSFGIMQKIVK